MSLFGANSRGIGSFIVETLPDNRVVGWVAPLPLGREGVELMMLTLLLVFIPTKIMIDVGTMACANIGLKHAHG
jgi:hypothetical protein